MEIITLLIRYGADVNGKSITRLTPFIAALMSDWTMEHKLDVLSYLVAQGAKVNETDNHWWILDSEGSFQFHSYLDVTRHYDGSLLLF